MPTLTRTRYCRGCACVLTQGNRSEHVRTMCSVCGSTRFECERCGGIRDIITQRYRETQMCTYCASADVIQSHSARPTYSPLGDERPTLGVELEVESDSQFVTTAEKVLEIFPEHFAIVKNDGSLNEHGFEICTRPADLPTMKQTWAHFFDSRSQIGRLISHSSQACGLHVHVSREGLSEHSIALIVCFVNLPKNRRFIQVIAGRANNGYAQFKLKPMRTAAQMTGDKYEAVNLNHPHTLEFRIFKGTLKRESFFKALEFCEALTRFCGETFNTRKALALNEFIKYAKANDARYPFLNAFIANRWFGKSNENGLDYWRLCNNAKPPLPPPDLMDGSRMGGEF